MQRIIALFVSAYWTAFFGLLAIAALADTAGGFGAAFEATGLPAMVAMISRTGGATLATGLAFGFALAAVLHFWSLLTALLHKAGGGDVDDVARMAFGVAVGLMTALLVVGAIYPVDGIFGSASLQVLALLVSYIAIYAEQRRSVHADDEAEDEAGAAARIMALGAAHNSLLPRISGRRMSTDKGF